MSLYFSLSMDRYTDTDMDMDRDMDGVMDMNMKNDCFIASKVMKMMMKKKEEGKLMI
jgi:hypothetical protein